MRRSKLMEYVHTRLEKLVGDRVSGANPMVDQLSDRAFDLCPTTLGRDPSEVGTLIIQAVVAWKSGGEPEDALGEFFRLATRDERRMLAAGHKLSRLERVRLAVERRL